MVKDNRFVYGANCTWYGPIAEAGSFGGLPVCPHCGGVLFEMATEKEWTDSVANFDARWPGYRALVEWTKGRHFADYLEAKEAYDREHQSKP